MYQIFKNEEKYALEQITKKTSRIHHFWYLDKKIKLVSGSNQDIYC